MRLSEFIRVNALPATHSTLVGHPHETHILSRNCNRNFNRSRDIVSEQTTRNCKILFTHIVISPSFGRIQLLGVSVYSIFGVCEWSLNFATVVACSAHIIEFFLLLLCSTARVVVVSSHIAIIIMRKVVEKVSLSLACRAINGWNIIRGLVSTMFWSGDWTVYTARWGWWRETKEA